MTSLTFSGWRERLKLSKAGAARALGLSRNTVQGYEEGSRKIPRHIALACAAIAHGLAPLE